MLLCGLKWTGCLTVRTRELVRAHDLRRCDSSAQTCAIQTALSSLQAEGLNKTNRTRSEFYTHTGCNCEELPRIFHLPSIFKEKRFISKWVEPCVEFGCDMNAGQGQGVGGSEKGKQRKLMRGREEPDRGGKYSVPAFSVARNPLVYTYAERENTGYKTTLVG